MASVSISDSPSTPKRSSSLSRKHRDSRLQKDEGSNMSGAAPAMAMPNSLSGMTSNDRTGTNSSHTAPTTNTSSTINDDDDDDDMVCVVRKHTVTIRAPMETYTELVPYDFLPAQTRQNPTEIMTWARQTPEYLYLETFVPPQCETCLAKLSSRSADTTTYTDTIATVPVTEHQEPVIPVAAEPVTNLPTDSKTMPATPRVADGYAKSMVEEREPVTSSNPTVKRPVAPQPIGSFIEEKSLADTNTAITKETIVAPQEVLSNVEVDKPSEPSVAAPALSPPLYLPGSFSW